MVIPFSLFYKMKKLNLNEDELFMLTTVREVIEKIPEAKVTIGRLSKLYYVEIDSGIEKHEFIGTSIFECFKKIKNTIHE